MKKKHISIFTIIVLVAVIIAAVSGGYWFYQRNIHSVIHSTTISFMEEIAAHDHQNMLNQMKTKWNALELTVKRLRSTRNYTIEDTCSDLNLDVTSGAFHSLYLVTEDGNIYSHIGEKDTLEDKSWSGTYAKHKGTFVDTYLEEDVRQQGEYMIYGIRLEPAIACEDELISGVVGFVSADVINNQLRIESYDNEGMAVLMKPSGETITSSREYDRPTNNYLEMLQRCRLEDGYTWEMVETGLANRERQIFRFLPPVRDYGYYVLIEPLGDPYDTGWFLVVQISELITTTQVNQLMIHSIIFFIIIGLICLGAALFIFYKLDEIKMLRMVEQAKTDFLTNMSHEIRTPLNGISGLCRLMQENLDDKEKVKSYLKQTIDSTSYLKDIINDVLDISKIENGKLSLAQDEINLSNVLSETINLIDPVVREKYIDFYMDTQGLKAKWIIGDQVRIKQILMNLLGNAIKFTEADGKVRLSVSQILEGNTAKTTFIIQDTGCGMSKEFLKKIWSPFEQERQISSQEGTGLGTSITKALVNQMGGTIDVESTLNQGTTFTVTIPFAIAREEYESTKAKSAGSSYEALNGKNILIVEDNDVNRMIVTTILKRYGCNITEAINGQVAVNSFEESPENFYDVILMDLQMPVMDGYEASRQIRKSTRADAKSVRIFAVTANAFKESLDAAIEAGMNDTIIKPIDVDVLLEKIVNTARYNEEADNPSHNCNTDQ